MSSLNDLLGASTQSDTGSGVTETGAVVIGSTVAGEPTEIKTSTGEPVVTVTDDGEFQLSETQAVREIVNAIVVGADDNDKKLATVQAIASFVAGAVTATIEFEEFTSKAEFDAFITDGGFIPTIAFVTDTTPFDYTDNTGHVGTDLTWMFVVCVEESGVVTTSMINNSDISSLTGDEIAAIIASTEDVNFVNDSDLSRIRNLPDNTADALGGKVNTEAGKGLSQNNFTDNQRNKVDNSPSDTNASLGTKLDKQSSGVNVRVTNPGTGNGSYQLQNTLADANEKLWRIIAKSDGSMTIDALEDDGVTVTETFEFNQAGVLSAKTLKQNTYSVVDTNDPMYVLISALLNGTMAQDMVLQSDSNSALTFKVPDNADSPGIAWQNTGESYTLTIEREVVGSFGADMVFRAGRDNDTSLIPEAMRIRGNEDGTAGTRGDVIVRQTLRADSVASTEEATARGQTLMHRRNFGLNREQLAYKSNFPSLSDSAIADWFTRGAIVYFFGVGSGTVNMPEIVDSDPTINQVVVGTEIELVNQNSGSAITLARHDTGQTFVDRDVSSTVSTYQLAASSRIKLAAVNLNSYSAIGKYCWVISV
ncbi:hypothetical protein NVP1287O_15 [Vibrio phage 1.287.O._10N.286.55.C7]|nr:hypothetical protein NVP1047O_15 [Vibrio phage 1.047.O._10N.286.55.F2]AUS01588.1 hypothetical protein NVP1287O_15 [Vibrio phage 1.287.O._10N.286.55.C7]AUS01658.1 hypothetical protein NVP1289A_14 [Vibrio phage 1.289.A._10N.286.55.E8]